MAQAGYGPGPYVFGGQEGLERELEAALKTDPRPAGGRHDTAATALQKWRMSDGAARDDSLASHILQLMELEDASVDELVPDAAEKALLLSQAAKHNKAGRLREPKDQFIADAQRSSSVRSG